ncbi:MAG: hypothetical protein CSA18_02820 [Deltaproteobacteria bacterium]|nr:MAG: hypothetical protein CSA18_02820 [Deltaproteobacteria bacterium]
MKKLKIFLLKLSFLDGSNHNIALGAAVGIFIAVTPTIPFHTAFAIVLASLVRGSKIAAAISVWFSNPVTIPFFYAGSYYAGIKLLGINHSEIDLIYSLLEQLQSDITIHEKIDAIILFFEAELPVFYAMLAGGAVLGIIPAIASYFIIKKSLEKLRSNKRNESSI